MIAPVVLGASLAWSRGYSFTAWIFALAMLGSVSLHLAANAIDDVFDYQSGTDAVIEQEFPPDSPGWKPIPRGLVSVRQGAAVAAAFYGLSLAAGLVLSIAVGWYALFIAVPGILLSFFYTAPPLKLDYRGMGLGELSILLSFGPIPILGTYYVLSGQLDLLAFAVGIPTGLLTAGILVTHDLIFYDAYKESGKRSLTVMLGRRRAAILSTVMALAAYVFVAAAVAARLIPAQGLLVLLATPLFVKFADLQGTERPPPEYGRRTMTVFIHSVLFTLLAAVGIALGGML